MVPFSGFKSPISGHLLRMKGEKEMPFVTKSCRPDHRKRGFVENLTQFHMKAVIVNVSIVVGLLAPVQLDSHARHKHVEDRVKEMLVYFVV